MGEPGIKSGLRPHGRPVVFLTVLLPLMLGGMLAGGVGLVALLARATGTTLATVPNSAAIVVGTCGLLLAIPATLMAANLVLLFVSPLRRIAEDDAARNSRPDFGASQRALWRLFLAFAAVLVPIIAATFAFAR